MSVCGMKWSWRMLFWVQDRREALANIVPAYAMTKEILDFTRPRRMRLLRAEVYLLDRACRPDSAR